MKHHGGSAKQVLFDDGFGADGDFQLLVEAEFDGHVAGVVIFVVYIPYLANLETVQCYGSRNLETGHISVGSGIEIGGFENIHPFQIFDSEKEYGKRDDHASADNHFFFYAVHSFQFLSFSFPDSKASSQKPGLYIALQKSGSVGIQIAAECVVDCRGHPVASFFRR